MTFHRYVGLYDRFVDFVIRFEDLFPKILFNFGNYLFPARQVRRRIIPCSCRA